ncbi:MAG TPA: glycosyltransferase [Beijerinckia sp.]|nr:glycosyltransferase [Beijerinckia sp.]
MIILHVIHSVNPETGGPIEGIFSSAGVLLDQGCQREIVSLDSPHDPWVKSCPLTVYPLGIKHPKYPAWRQKFPWLRYGYTPHLVPWLKENAHRYDAIIVNGLWNYVAFGSWRALSKCKTPYFVYPHGMLDPWLKNFAVKAVAKQVLWWFSEGPLLANARRVLFTTEEERVLARNIFWPYKCQEMVVAYGSLDVTGDPQTQEAAFQARLPQIAGRRFLLFLSRIHPKKGCDLLIEAFANVAAKDPDLDLVMAGPDSVGWVENLQAAASKHGIAHRIHWPGMLKGDAKWGAFRSCEAFVLPSHQENFGIVVAEAMSCGRPVLTTSKVNTWREVQDCGGGLISSDDQAGIIELLNLFVGLSEHEKKAMGQCARQGFVEKFDMRAMAPQVIQAFQAAEIPKDSTPYGWLKALLGRAPWTKVIMENSGVSSRKMEQLEAVPSELINQDAPVLRL